MMMTMMMMTMMMMTMMMMTMSDEDERLIINSRALHSYLNIYISAITAKTAGPNGLTFFVGKSIFFMMYFFLFHGQCYFKI